LILIAVSDIRFDGNVGGLKTFTRPVRLPSEPGRRFMRMSSAHYLALAAILVGCCWGCGSGSAVPPSLISVKGKVTYKGQPVTKGIVRFEPDGFGRMATGELQSDGTFELSTLKPGDGAVPGEHRVTVNELDKSLAKNRALKKYASANISGLKAEVSPEKHEFTFDLK
jgi:hypothetical protein